MPKKETKSSDLERIPSGIPGLDELIEGGFLKGSTNLVSGAAGTGKTIFCSQFIWEGLQRGESCMFITLEERPEDIMGDVKRFGWDFDKYIEEKKLLAMEFLLKKCHGMKLSKKIWKTKRSKQAIRLQKQRHC